MFRYIVNRHRAKTVIAFCLLLYLSYYFGAFTHLLEVDFKDFSYPLQGPLLNYARQLRNGETPAVRPINEYNYTFLRPCSLKCIDSRGERVKPRLVFLIKSALDHFERRKMIRMTWGYERRFSDVPIRTIFLLGVPREPDYTLQRMIDAEYEKFGDIVQADFVDSYFNNTIKTMLGFRWAQTFCANSKFYMVVDDDYLVSTKNILLFVRDPINYPDYLEEAEETMRKLARRLSSTQPRNKTQLPLVQTTSTRRKGRRRRKRQVAVFSKELPDDVRLFAGFVFNSAPHRHQSSKWYVPLSEYPYGMWPPYVTAGGFIMSREAMLDLYFVSKFTQHFRFDDIFLGIVAMKAEITPLHSEEFHFHKAPYQGPQSYKYLLASHGYGNPNDLQRVWNQLRSSGYA